MQTESIQGNKYFITIVDDYTGAYFAYYLKTKSQAFTHFKSFYAYITNSLGYPLWNAQFDRGGEFTGNEFTGYLRDCGIARQLTAPDTPMQNGQAEHANCTIMESGRAMLHHAGMSHGFWEHAVSTAVYVWNRSPHRSNKYTSPYECLKGYPPDLDHLRVFGCLAYRHIHKDHRWKLDPKAK